MCLACSRLFLLATGRAPAAGLTFLCFAKEKISKRKASQRPWPCGLPCATRAVRGRAQTRYAQTSARPNPVAAALLSTANGKRGPRVLVRCAHLAHACWRAAGAAPQSPMPYALCPMPYALCPMPQTIYYNRFVHQPGRTNPHRNATIQNPSPRQKNKIGCSSSPSPRRG